MNNKIKLIFFVVFVLTNLLMQRFIFNSDFQIGNLVSAVIGGVIAVLIMSYLQNRKTRKE